MRILVVEDEHKIANAVKQGLEQQSYAVDVAYDADKGLSMATTEPYDLIILDRMLPGNVDGLGILQTLRKDGNHVPVLLLTAKDRILDKAHGLNMGADDYLIKPFPIERLVARARALLRREAVQRSRFVQVRDLEVDLVHRQVWRKGAELPLTPREWAVFEMLLRNEGRPVSKAQLYQRIWHDDASVGSNVLEVYIRMLRAKLDDDTEVKLIKTLYGIGYLLERPEEKS